jgi:hypothetical protein
MASAGAAALNEKSWRTAERALTSGVSRVGLCEGDLGKAHSDIAEKHTKRLCVTLRRPEMD